MLAIFRRRTPVQRLPKSEANIGNVLLAMGYLSRDELLEGIRAKLAADRDQLLGEVLVARGFITRSQLERALAAQTALVGPRPYADQIRAQVARGVAALEDTSDMAEVRQIAERISKRLDEEKAAGKA